MCTCTTDAFPHKSKEMEPISFSRWTVARRIDEIANDVNFSLHGLASKFEALSITLDESTDTTDTAQLAMFIHGVDSDFNLAEKLLALQPMKDTTRGEDIFQEIKDVFNRFDLR